MADQEELRIMLRTVAEGRGAQETREQLRGVRTAAGDTQKSLAGVSSGFKFGAADAFRFVGALSGVTLGLSLATGAGQQLQETLSGAVQSQAEAQRTARAVAAAYGEQAAQFTKFSQALSQQTGFTSQSILEAALTARTLSSNYGVTIEQTQRLIAVSADLAHVRGIGVAEAFTRVSDAIRGEAESAEFLQLTLGDTFLKNVANNGAFRDTFETMTEAQKSQIRYAEVLRQTQIFQGIAAKGLSELDGRMSVANTSAANLSLTLGRMVEGPAIAGLNAYAAGLDLINERLIRLREGNLADFIPPKEALLASLPLAGPLGAPVIAALLAAQEEARKQAREGASRAGQSLDVDFQKEMADNRRGMSEAIPVAVKYGETFRLVDEVFQRTHRSIAQVAADVAEVQGRMGQLSSIAGALDVGDTGLQAQLQVALDLERIDARVNAQRAAAALQRERERDKEASKITDPRDTSGALAARERVRAAEQLLPLELAVAEAQREQAEVAKALAANQSAEARAILQVLPQRQEMARLEWEMANSVDRRLALRQTEGRLLAQQAALGPNNALDDTQAQIRRNELLLAIRGQDPEVRRAARAENRALRRDVRPGQELTAFDADRRVTVAQRGETATNLAEQIRQNPIQQQIEAVRLAAVAGERQVFAIDQNSQVLSHVGTVLGAAVNTAQQALDAAIKKLADPVKVDLNIAVTGPDGNVEIYQELIEASERAQTPPVIQVSAVRRR